MTESASVHSNDRRICTLCIMDTSDPEITFDGDGVCNHCRAFESAERRRPSLEERERRAATTIDRIKKDGKGKEYDCILGLSGGVDSSYLAHEAVSRGLRPLAVHVDTGWNSELAVKNVESLVKKLDVDLHTIVVDWEEMKDLQAAFMRSGLANQDVPQDHAIVSSVLEAASANSIGWILSGANHATESILPNAWGYNARDARHLRSVSRRFGKRKLKRYPSASFFQQYVYYPYVRRIRKFKLLNFIDYNKAKAMSLLERDYGWRYYGGKHYESRFTKFFQGYYLPTKFGYDKRRAHLSSLIVSGQITRDEALAELDKPVYPLEELEEDIEFVLKKLGISGEEFEAILSGPNRTHREFPSDESLFQFKNRLKARIWAS